MRNRLNFIGVVRLGVLGALAGCVALAATMAAGVGWRYSVWAAVMAGGLGLVAAACTATWRGQWSGMASAAQWLDRAAGTSDGFATVLGLKVGSVDRAAVETWLRRRIAETSGRLPVPAVPVRWYGVMGATAGLVLLAGSVAGQFAQASAAQRLSLRVEQGGVLAASVTPPPPGPSETSMGAASSDAQTPTPDGGITQAQERSARERGTGTGAAAGETSLGQPIARHQASDKALPSPRVGVPVTNGVAGGSSVKEIGPASASRSTAASGKEGNAATTQDGVSVSAASPVTEPKGLAASRTQGISSAERDLLKRYFGW